jgi:hypothetical protein
MSYAPLAHLGLLTVAACGTLTAARLDAQEPQRLRNPRVQPVATVVLERLTAPSTGTVSTVTTEWNASAAVTGEVEVWYHGGATPERLGSATGASIGPRSRSVQVTTAPFQPQQGSYSVRLRTGGRTLEYFTSLVRLSRLLGDVRPIGIRPGFVQYSCDSSTNKCTCRGVIDCALMRNECTRICGCNVCLLECDNDGCTMDWLPKDLVPDAGFACMLAAATRSHS